MTNQLSDLDTQFIEHLKGADMAGPWGLGIAAVLEKPTPELLEKLRDQLISQWGDDPRVMFKILRFDLPKFLGMKMYDVEELNKELARMAYAYRVTEPTRMSDRTAEWLGRTGFFHLVKNTGTVWVDSNFNRYLHLSNGQFFRCTNSDLEALPEDQKQHIRNLLTGLMD